MIKIINVYKDTRVMEMTPSSNIGLGVKTDNEVDLLRFTFDEFYSGTATLLTDLKDEHGDNVAFSLTANEAEKSYDLEVTKYLASQTDFTIQLEIVHTEDVVWHSKQAMVRLDDCLNVGEGEMPTTIENWLTNANIVLEEMQEAVTEANNLNIQAEKDEGKTTITITHKDGTEQEVEILDGQSAIISGASATIDSGIGTPSVNVTMGGTDLDRTFTFEFSNLKGDKGDAGAIKFLIVAELPATGADDTIYLVPYPIIYVQTLPTIGEEYTIYIVESTNKRYVYESNQWSEIKEKNKYKEYIYVNNDWELFGSLNAEIDLTDYVKNTDYATSSKGGVIKSGYYGLQVDSTNGKAYCDTYTYANYGNVENQRFVSKGTLENVITGKDLTTKAYVDGLIGNLETILETLDTGGGVQ